MLEGSIPALDIRTFMRVLVIILALGTAFVFFSGVASIRESRRMKYYRLRRGRLLAGWRMILISLGILGITLAVNQFGEPVVYSFYSITTTPTLTVPPTLTPTETLTPTITLTPTVTPTLSETYTPTPTQTPSIPLAVEVQFSGTLTPPPEAVFSPLRFAEGIDLAYNPIKMMYAIFSYDKMADGAQWTALWYRDGELVYFETKPWEGGTGGFGFSDWAPEPEAWLPGVYQVQMFVGFDLIVFGDFEVVGFPPTKSPTPSNTPTATATLTPTPSNTPTITLTPTITITRWPTQTPTNTRTPFPPTATKIPTSTPQPTWTPIPTRTFRPSATP